MYIVGVYTAIVSWGIVLFLGGRHSLLYYIPLIGINKKYYPDHYTFVSKRIARLVGLKQAFVPKFVNVHIWIYIIFAIISIIIYPLIYTIYLIFFYEFAIDGTFAYYVMLPSMIPYGISRICYYIQANIWMHDETKNKK